MPPHHAVTSLAAAPQVPVGSRGAKRGRDEHESLDDCLDPRPRVGAAEAIASQAGLVRSNQHEQWQQAAAAGLQGPAAVAAAPAGTFGSPRRAPPRPPLHVCDPDAPKKPPCCSKEPPRVKAGTPADHLIPPEAYIRHLDSQGKSVDGCCTACSSQVHGQ